MSYSPILRLPPETLDDILSLLNQTSLNNLSQACRALQQLVEPWLYHTVLIQNGQDKLFTSAIGNKPARAEYVQELQIHYHEDVEDEEDYYPLCAQALSPTIRQLQNLKSLIVKGLDEDNFPLSFEPSIDKSARFQNLFLEAAMPQSSVLQSLRTCMFHAHCAISMMRSIYTDECEGILNLHEQQTWELADLDAIFIHPTLQHLTIVNGRMASFTSFDPARVRSTDLQELTLIACDIKPAQLHKILSMPKALRSFTAKGSAWLGRSVSGEDRAASLESLRMHASSLVSMDLDFFLGDGQMPQEPLVMVDFTVLQQLAIPLWILRGHIEQGIVRQERLLPRWLKELTLKCAGQHTELESYYLEPVFEWRQHGALPILEKLSLEVTAPVPNVPDAGWWCFWEGLTVREAFEVKAFVKLSMVEEAAGGYVPFECECCWYNYRNRGWGTATTGLY